MSWKTTDSRPAADATSGNHWCPRATASIVSVGALHARPSGELRTKTFACPSAMRALHTTCTPVASAATADWLEKRAYVSPLGQMNGPSPQVSGP